MKNKKIITFMLLATISATTVVQSGITVIANAAINDTSNKFTNEFTVGDAKISSYSNSEKTTYKVVEGSKTNILEYNNKEDKLYLNGKLYEGIAKNEGVKTLNSSKIRLDSVDEDWYDPIRP